MPPAAVYLYFTGISKQDTMQYTARSIRPFVGAANFEKSRAFYQELGFTETVLFHNMSLFSIGNLGFYLQDAYVKDWVDNTMIFLEVEDLARHFKDLQALDLASRYEGVKLSPIRKYNWGQECFLHDPSGVLWHIGEFSDSYTDLG